MTDIIDQIDSLIDEQLAAGEPVRGFDFGDPQFPKCWHCGSKSAVRQGKMTLCKSRATAGTAPGFGRSTKEIDMGDATPYGYCECGCGQQTAMAKRNHHEAGICKGEPMRYVQSHSGRSRTKLAPSPEVRFWRYVDKTGSCWIWTGAKFPLGYGSFAIGSRTTGLKYVQAHRFCYELLREGIPAGLVLDHLCRNPSCVNPDHLEPVSQRTNALRGIGPAAINSRKTHCPHGHPYNERNTRWYQRPGYSAPSRYCRQCETDRNTTDQPHGKDKMVCIRGHDLTVGSPNVRVVIGRSGSSARVCRSCARENMANYRARKATG